MQKFERLTAVAAPLVIDNIDTDQLIPVRRMLASMTPDYGAGLFANWRYLQGDEPNPDFILNRAPFDRAGILLAGENFACGSSREQAVWALMAFGIRCVVAMSYGEIFYNNCFKQGVLPVVLPAAQVRALADEAAKTGGAPFTVDLLARRITTEGGTVIEFPIDESLREILLEGLDEIGQTLKHEPDISGFQARDRQLRPWIYTSL